MPFNRPALQDLRSRVANDIERTLEGADAHTAGTGYTELAVVVAGVVHGLYGHQQWIANQITIATADDATIAQRSDALGVPRIPAAAAAGSVTLTGTNATTIPVATMLQSNAGTTVRTTAMGTVDNGSVSVAVVAQQAGVAGDLATATTLTLITPVAGIDSQATVDAPGLTGGADIEPIARVRERLLGRRRQPPMGGKDYDYISWARAASVDVTRAWVFPHENGIGSMVVRFVTEALENVIPTVAHVAAVSDYLAERRPTGLRNLTIEAPTAAPLDLVFTRLAPNTDPVKTAVDAELKDLIRREGATGGTLLLSHIRAAISRATGESDFSITLDHDLSYANDKFPTVGTTIWPGA